jgi:hypothetical protein
VYNKGNDIIERYTWPDNPKCGYCSSTLDIAFQCRKDNCDTSGGKVTNVNAKSTYVFDYNDDDDDVQSQSFPNGDNANNVEIIEDSDEHMEDSDEDYEDSMTNDTSENEAVLISGKSVSKSSTVVITKRKTRTYNRFLVSNKKVYLIYNINCLLCIYFL